MFGFTKANSKKTHRQTDMSGGYVGGATGVMTGLISDTKVATGIGWREVGGIAEGDQVLTFDHGMQIVSRVTRTLLWTGEDSCPRHFWPLEISPGVIGNEQTVNVLPSQGVLLESDYAEEAFGDPFALLPAITMDNMDGVCRKRPTGPIEVITLQFEDDQVLFTNTGALLFCTGACDLIEQLALGKQNADYRMMTPQEAAIALCGTAIGTNSTKAETPERHNERTLTTA